MVSIVKNVFANRYLAFILYCTILSSPGSSELLAAPFQFKEFCYNPTLPPGALGLWVTNGTSQTFLSRNQLTQRLELPHNGWETVSKELLDPDFLPVIARFCGLTQTAASTVQISGDPQTGKVRLNQIADPEKPFEILSKGLDSYVRERAEGHTKEFLMTALTNESINFTTSNKFLLAIKKAHPLLPASLFKEIRSGSYTNRPGTERTSGTRESDESGKFVVTKYRQLYGTNDMTRWANFLVIDGEVAWSFHVTLEDNYTTENNVFSVRADAKEEDPKYREAIKEVEDEVRASFIRDKININQTDRFIRLMKEKLKSRGIDWRSPEELSPGTPPT
jgi:hypothetical protein